MFKYIIVFSSLFLMACSGSLLEADPPGAQIDSRPSVDIGGLCGGLAGIACTGEASGAAFCRFEAGAMCGAADQMGVCSPVPQACTREYRPVCGCDGQTYPNVCVASSNQVGVLHEGVCR